MAIREIIRHPQEDENTNPQPLAPVLYTAHGALFHADCLAVLHAMRTDSVHCIFADPPFNLGKEYRNGFADVQNEAHYFAWCEAWIAECWRLVGRSSSMPCRAWPIGSPHF